jgi:ubiquitin-like 1-activating enzyme E1 B
MIQQLTTAPAEEIENLRQESQALKRIRGAMGSPNFAQKVFQKVFTNDINRLRSMEDMWKSRTPPTTLEYERLLDGAKSLGLSVSFPDQRSWTQEENFAVFANRYF